MTVTELPQQDDTDEQDDPREELDLRPNGTVHVWLEGVKHRLRRPRLREFRHLRESFQDAADEIQALAEEAQQFHERQVARLEQRRQEDPDSRLTAEEKLEDRRLSRKLTEQTEELMLGWWADVFATLTPDGHHQPDPDDLPPWLGSTQAAGKLIGHWRAVPSRSGGR